MAQAVVVQPLHERLARVPDDVPRKRQLRDAGVGALVEVKATLVAQLMRNLRLTFLQSIFFLDYFLCVQVFALTSDYFSQDMVNTLMLLCTFGNVKAAVIAQLVCDLSITLRQRHGALWHLPDLFDRSESSDSAAHMCIGAALGADKRQCQIALVQMAIASTLNVLDSARAHGARCCQLV